MKSFTVSCRASHLAASCQMDRDGYDPGAATIASRLAHRPLNPMRQPLDGMMTPDHCVDEEGMLELPHRSIHISVI